MNARHNIVPAAIALFGLVQPAPAQSPAPDPFCDGERLVYDVRWSFLHLGTVTVMQQMWVVDGRPRATARTVVRSNPSIPFLDLDFVHETVFRPLDLRIERETITAGGRARTSYVHEPSAQSIVMVDSLDGRECRRDTVAAASQCYDINTLLLYARRSAHQNTRATLPTVIDYAVNPTDITMTGECEWVDVPAFEESVRSRHFTGDAHWVGTSFAGMKGRFEGWVSDDEAAVPLRASVKILVGSIVLELASYERPGWNTAALSDPAPSLVDSQVCRP